MVSIYKTDKDGMIHTISTLENNSWIDVTSPTKEEIEHILEKTNVDEDLIRKVL